MKQVRVTKVSKNDNTFRTPLEEIDGMPVEPMEGKRLFLLSSTFVSGGIVTSPVREVEVSEDGKKYAVRTENSVYHIEVLG